MGHGEQQPVAKPKDVAIEFLRLAQDNGTLLTQMQIQKLVYFAHGWFLAKNNGQPLVGEPVEAWKWGPVFPSLYRIFRSAGASQIRLGKDIVPLLDEATKSHIKEVWERYKDQSAGQMSNRTHRKGTPWDTVVNDQNGGVVKSHTPIDNDLIKDHFSGLLASKSGSQTS